MARSAKQASSDGNDDNSAKRRRDESGRQSASKKTRPNGQSRDRSMQPQAAESSRSNDSQAAQGDSRVSRVSRTTSAVADTDHPAVAGPGPETIRHRNEHALGSVPQPSPSVFKPYLQDADAAHSVSQEEPISQFPSSPEANVETHDAVNVSIEQPAMASAKPLDVSDSDDDHQGNGDGTCQWGSCTYVYESIKDLGTHIREHAFVFDNEGTAPSKIKAMEALEREKIILDVTNKLSNMKSESQGVADPSGSTQRTQILGLETQVQAQEKTIRELKEERDKVERQLGTERQELEKQHNEQLEAQRAKFVKQIDSELVSLIRHGRIHTLSEALEQAIRLQTEVTSEGLETVPTDTTVAEARQVNEALSPPTSASAPTEITELTDSQLREEFKTVKEKLARKEANYTYLNRQNGELIKERDAALKQLGGKNAEIETQGVRIETLQSQLINGLKQRDLFAAAKAAKLAEDLRLAQAQLEILLAQSRRTDDKVRERASLYMREKRKRQTLESTYEQVSAEAQALKYRNTELTDLNAYLRQQVLAFSSQNDADDDGESEDDDESADDEDEDGTDDENNDQGDEDEVDSNIQLSQPGLEPGLEPGAFEVTVGHETTVTPIPLFDVLSNALPGYEGGSLLGSLPAQAPPMTMPTFAPDDNVSPPAMANTTLSEGGMEVFRCKWALEEEQFCPEIFQTREELETHAMGHLPRTDPSSPNGD